MGDQELVGQPAPWDNLDGSPVFKTSILLVRRLPNFMHCGKILYHLSYQGSPKYNISSTQMWQKKKTNLGIFL